MRSRGQVSVEYLMTYGWAILIVLSLVIIAWNMGLIGIAGEVEPGQLGFWGVVPKDYVLHTNGVFSLTLENQLDHEVTVQDIQLILGQEELSHPFSNWGTIAPGNISEIGSISQGQLYKQTRGENYKMFMNITYTENQQGYEQTHVSSGWLWSFVEP